MQTCKYAGQEDRMQRWRGTRVLTHPVKPGASTGTRLRLRGREFLINIQANGIGRLEHWPFHLLGNVRFVLQPVQCFLGVTRKGSIRQNL